MTEAVPGPHEGPIDDAANRDDRGPRLFRYGEAAERKGDSAICATVNISEEKPIGDDWLFSTEYYQRFEAAGSRVSITGDGSSRLSTTTTNSFS